MKTLIIASISLGMLGCQKVHNTAEPICQSKQVPFLHTICSKDANPATLKLYWQDPKTHKPLYTFNALSKHSQETIVFAMNGGMYDDNFAPIGYTIIDKQPIKALNLNDGGGNFHLKPNGVFWWDDERFYVDESHSFADKLKTGIQPRYATQSGPMLIINGQIHPAFNPASTSLKIRNGVGVDCSDGRIHFIISDEGVNFYDFAHVFKSTLGCQNALFLDGGVASALYAPNLGRSDTLNMGVMITATSGEKR